MLHEARSEDGLDPLRTIVGWRVCRALSLSATGVLLSGLRASSNIAVLLHTFADVLHSVYALDILLRSLHGNGLLGREHSASAFHPSGNKQTDHAELRPIVVEWVCHCQIERPVVRTNGYSSSGTSTGHLNGIAVIKPFPSGIPNFSV